jgi:hypothetical protein
MMTPENNSQLSDLLEFRYKSDFSENRRAVGWILHDLMWKRYLKRYGIKILHDSLSEQRDTPGENDVVVQILWYQGLIMILAIPEEFAVKCLLLGEFPPGSGLP